MKLSTVFIYCGITLAVVTVVLAVAHLSIQPIWPSWLGAIAHSDDVAEWSAVWATVAAIMGAVWAGYLHQDRQAKIATADQVTAAYILARIAGSAVIDADRWHRNAAADPVRLDADREEAGRYPHRWKAWGKSRLDTYLQNLQRLDASKIPDASFIKDLVTVHSRATWYKDEIARHIGNGTMPLLSGDLLPVAAYDVMKSLASMRAKVDVAREGTPLGFIVVDPLPESSAPNDPDIDADKWHQSRVKA